MSVTSIDKDPDALASYFQQSWRRNQLSDHFPIWFELVVDSSDAFLKEKLAALGGPPT